HRTTCGGRAGLKSAKRIAPGGRLQRPICRLQPRPRRGDEARFCGSVACPHQRSKNKGGSGRHAARNGRGVPQQAERTVRTGRERTEHALRGEKTGGRETGRSSFFLDSRTGARYRAWSCPVPHATLVETLGVDANVAANLVGRFGVHSHVYE